jgi:hypothetical protein
MIKWLCAKLVKCGLDQEYGDSAVQAPQPMVGRLKATTAMVSDQIEIRGLNFTVMAARGGTIVQLNTYNEKTSERYTSTYVITQEEDVATEVGRLVSMEILRA